jgi:hypothetical protein
MGSWTISSAHGVWGRIWLEVRKQCVIAGPMVCTNLLQYSITIVSIIYVGHLGELELSSASIATSFASVTGYTLLVKLLLAPPLCDPDSKTYYCCRLAYESISNFIVS